MSIPYLVSFKMYYGTQNALTDRLHKIAENYYLELSDNLVMIDSMLTANQIYDELHKNIESRDNNRVLITEANKNMQGWLNKNSWNEIKKNF